jgi:hypothetical protein
MVPTKDYNQSENGEENIEELISIVKEESSLLPNMTVDHFQRWNYKTFEDMDNHKGGSMVRDRYSGRANGVAFNNWKTRFWSWQGFQRQRNRFFNDRWTFEQLPNHLEAEPLQFYDIW